MAHYYRLLRLLVLLTLIGCSSLPISQGDRTLVSPVTVGETQTAIVVGTLEAKGNLIPTAIQDIDRTAQPSGKQFVRLWLPPEFDPNGDRAASGILKARLQEFEAENPLIRLEVRVKTLEGAGGLLDSLVAASAAAPSGLPDLILLPRPLLESAALKGLLYPYDGLTGIMEDRSWFEYSRQLAHVKSSTYGIPFAGDIMVLAHSLSYPEASPPDLDAILASKGVLLFPAADPQALFTLCMYLAEGGKVQDDQGRPALEEEPLVNILNFDQQASLAEVLPYTLTQYSDDAQVWEAFLSGQFPMAVTWASTYLSWERTGQDNLVIAPLPTPDGDPFTLAMGWSWSLAGQDPVRRLLSVKLAEYLVEKDFMAEWSQAAGYLPTREDALQNWPANQTRQVIEQLSYSAWLVPSMDLISTIGPALQQAVMDVLEARSDAQSAAQAAIGQINKP